MILPTNALYQSMSYKAKINTNNLHLFSGLQTMAWLNLQTTCTMYMYMYMYGWCHIFRMQVIIKVYTRLQAPARFPITRSGTEERVQPSLD